MSVREQGVIHQAVAFFDADTLVKEMLYVEFEAVLDQVVGLPEFAGQEVGACFLRINHRLQIVGAVFFLVDFDARGYVNRSWNVPLQHLLDNAGRGPDLGAGRIRLSCRSQCSIPWHARQLWDPILEGQNSSLRQMQQAVQRNRLGLAVDVPELTQYAIAEPPLLEETAASNAAPGAAKAARVEQVVPTKKAVATGNAESADMAETERQIAERTTQRLQQEYRGKMTALKEEQQLQLAALKSSLQEQIDQQHQHYQIQLSQLQETVESTKQLFVDEKRRSQKLKDKLAAQVNEFQQLRAQLQSEMAQERGQEQAKLQQLEQQFEVELNARIEQSSSELKEMLDMREVELFYREEQLGTLRDEIARLRQERERLINLGGDHLLQHLVENGVAFVAYQPGVEAMTISVADIPRYLESPLAYVAEKCRVTLGQYQQWLNHYDLPICTAQLDNGTVCGEPLAKVARPSEFMPGSSDRCSAHIAEHAPLAAQKTGSH